MPRAPVPRASGAGRGAGDVSGGAAAFVRKRQKKEKTLAFFQETDMDAWTYNKALQKTRESYRVTPEDKEMLKGMKR